MSARVLVIGGTGLIGAEAVIALASLGAEVHVAARHASTASLPAGVTAHDLDIFDETLVTALLSTLRPTHLLHMAWVTAHGKFWDAPENDEWRAHSLRLVQWFADRGGQRLVMAGTCAEYDWTHPSLVTEPCREAVTPIRSATFYGRMKNATHQEVAAFCADRSLSMAWGRIFWLFGPREDARRLIGSIISKLQAGEPAPCSPGSQVRDFMAVEDLGAAFAALTLSGVEGAVNMASGNGIRVGDLALLIGRLMERPELIRLGALPMREDDPPHLVADVTRLQREVGFQPTASLEERLAACIRHLASSVS